MNKRSFFIFVIFISIFSFFSCQYIPFKNQKINDLEKHDGSYSISFICGEICMANAIIEIKNGKIDGEVQNIKQQSFLVIGYVEEKGTLQLQSISENSDESIEAYGMVSNDGTITGSYSVENRTCNLFGFCFTKNKNEIVTQYDGMYKLELIRDGNKIENFKIRIQNGEFQTNISTKTNELYKIDGKISKNGNIILNTLFSNKNKGLTVIGSIQKDGSVKGDYYTNSRKKGVFSGNKLP
ncbi:hypothetical protein MHK_009378 [Candidatus Magnetomorum sp. HK-1]|nr:hypothetical protein MHK_009378 [Candidatus Magnetomorum sp. HK-1]